MAKKTIKVINTISGEHTPKPPREPTPKEQVKKLLEEEFGPLNLDEKLYLKNDYYEITRTDDFGDTIIVAKIPKENTLGASFKDHFKLFPFLIKAMKNSVFNFVTDNIDTMNAENERDGLVFMPNRNGKWYVIMEPKLLFELLRTEPLPWLEKNQETIEP